jgi:hypothetical protein
LRGSEYQRSQHGVPEPGPDDVALCRRAMASTNDEVRSHACLALEQMVAAPFFGELPPVDRAGLVRPLLAALSSGHGDTSEWSVRALRRLAAKAYLPAEGVRAALAQGLDLVTREDVEARRRGALLLEALTAREVPADRLQIARTLLLALDRYPRSGDEDDRSKTARTTCCGVLARIPGVDATLAGELAARFLRDLRVCDAWGFHYGRGDALQGLGRQFAHLRGGQREETLAVLLAAVGDPELEYMRTSGVRSPLRHRGHEALVPAVPAMTQPECERARARVSDARRAAAAKKDATDVAGIYDEVEAALAARRQ